MQLKQSLVIATVSQMIGLTLSVLIAFVVPKLLGLAEYGYWQLFIFYSGYAGLFLFGLNDGIYLLCDEKKSATQEERVVVANQFRFALILQLLIGAVIVALSLFMRGDAARIFVLAAFALSMVATNMVGVVGYYFQAINRTDQYSGSVLVSKVAYFFLVLALVFCSVDEFQLYVLAYVVAQYASLLYCSYCARWARRERRLPISEVIKKSRAICSVGIKVTIANIASLFVLGAGRLVVDYVWGIEGFGEFSFAIAIMSFFMTFVIQVSLVFLPSIREWSEEARLDFFKRVDRAMNALLPLLFVLYIPIEYLVGLWLPDYELGLQLCYNLLGCCMLEIKFNVLYATFLKLYKLEKRLLYVTFVAVAISVVGCFFGGLCHSMMAIVAAINIATCVKVLGSQLALRESIGDVNLRGTISVIVLAFVYGMVVLLPAERFAVLAVLLVAVNLFLRKRDIAAVVSAVRREC